MKELLAGTLLGLAVGFTIGMSVKTVTLIYKIKRAERDQKETEEELHNAETRALIHFRKLNNVEKILNHSDEVKEFYYQTIEKIKKVVYQPSNK